MSAILDAMADIIQFQPSFLKDVNRDAFDFADVTFKKDFGPWKRGQMVELLCLDLSTMTLGEFDIIHADLCPGDDPCYIKSCKLTFTPKEIHESPQRKTRKTHQRESREKGTHPSRSR